MPTNLYGPGDNYHRENSHVLPALLRRFHEAKESGAATVTLWGTGVARREFLHVDDLASAMLTLLELEAPPDWINAGSGSDIPIFELAHMIARVTGFQGELAWDASRPDGTLRKFMDSSRLLATGWKPKYDLESGIRHTYADFLNRVGTAELRQRYWMRALVQRVREASVTIEANIRAWIGPGLLVLVGIEVHLPALGAGFSPSTLSIAGWFFACRDT